MHTPVLPVPNSSWHHPELHVPGFDSTQVSRTHTPALVHIAHPDGQLWHVSFPPAEYCVALQRTHDPLSKPYAWLPDPALHPVQTEALAHVVQPVGQVAHAAVPPAEYSLAAHAAHVVLPS